MRRLDVAGAMCRPDCEKFENNASQTA